MTAKLIQLTVSFDHPSRMVKTECYEALLIYHHVSSFERCGSSSWLDDFHTHPDVAGDCDVFGFLLLPDFFRQMEVTTKAVWHIFHPKICLSEQQS